MECENCTQLKDRIKELEEEKYGGAYKRIDSLHKENEDLKDRIKELGEELAEEHETSGQYCEWKREGDKKIEELKDSLKEKKKRKVWVGYRIV
jgi:uncharacterized coiled-coil DUF342 family protein